MKHLIDNIYNISIDKIYHEIFSAFCPDVAYNIHTYHTERTRERAKHTSTKTHIQLAVIIPIWNTRNTEHGKSEAIQIRHN